MLKLKYLILRALLMINILKEKICISSCFVRNWNILTLIINISIAKAHTWSWNNNGSANI